MLTVPFSFLRARPNEVRGEQLNIGLVAFLPDGPKVFIDAPHWRVRALHPDLDVVNWSVWATQLESALTQLGSAEEGLDWLQHGLGIVRADSTLGHLKVENERRIADAISTLMTQVVSIPERTISAVADKTMRPKSRLHAHLRSWFRSAKIYSPNISDLSKSKVVSSYPIDVSGDLYADFALKNGSVHIIETLDFRGVARVTKTQRGTAGLAAVLFDQAKKVLPEGGKTIAVTSADDYASIKPLVGLIDKYADDVFHLESPSDRQRLADFVSISLKVDRDLVPLAQIDTSS